MLRAVVSGGHFGWDYLVGLFRWRWEVLVVGIHGSTVPLRWSLISQVDLGSLCSYVEVLTLKCGIFLKGPQRGNQIKTGPLELAFIQL